MQNTNQQIAQQKIQLIDKYIGGINFSKIQLSTKDDIIFAENLIRELHEKNKELEKLKRTITSPLETAKRATNKLFKPAQDMVRDTINILKEKIILFETLQIVEAEEKQEYPEQTVTLPRVQKLCWSVEDENKIPDKYMKYIVDHDKIEKAVKQNGEETNIPGIKVYWKESLRSG